MTPDSRPRSAQGAALLAFMLALIAGSSWLLLSDLNGHTQFYHRRAGSGLALNQAKQALLSYAMNYPDLRDNPGERSGVFALSGPEQRWPAGIELRGDYRNDPGPFAVRHTGAG